jgi:hypothetical protein
VHSAAVFERQRDELDGVVQYILVLVQLALVAVVRGWMVLLRPRLDNAYIKAVT